MKAATLLSFGRINLESVNGRFSIISGSKAWLIGMILGLSSYGVLAQAPEQDCFNAINVCTQSFSQAEAFNGFGGLNEILQGAGCLQNGEVNSV
ncbi:MAG: hypothetical protein ACI9FU_000327 [Granulosicoccus sp.]